MKNEVLTDGIKFLVDQNIIYCYINSNFNEHKIGVELEETFSHAILKLSDGKYIPLLINMTELNFLVSLKMFRYLSKNKLIKTLVLSKTFLVQTSLLKFLLCIYCLTIESIVSIRVFNFYTSAIRDCKKKYMEFNM